MPDFDPIRQRLIEEATRPAGGAVNPWDRYEACKKILADYLLTPATYETLIREIAEMLEI